ncbi:MAG: hypothetical protein AB8F94_23210 [Saprospiraceae bacterium]
MRLHLIVFLLYFSFSLISQTDTPLVELEYTTHYGQRDMLTIEFYLKNNTDDTVIIHRPRAIKYRPNGNPPAPMIPEFYSLKFLTNVTFCEIAPYFVDSYKGIPTKSERDFLKIPPRGQQQILFTTRQTDQMICDKNLSEVKLQLEYNFDQRYLDKAFFKKEIEVAGNLSATKSQQLYELLEKSYKGKIVSKVITLELNDLKKVGDDDLKKSQAIRKAKRMFDLEITELFHPDFLGKIPCVKIQITDEIKEKDLADLQRNLVAALPRASNYHTIVMQGDVIKWVVGSARRKKSPVHIYDYQSVMDSVNTTIQLLETNNEFSILKDFEIQNVYYSMQNLGAGGYRLLSKIIFIIVKDEEGKLYSYNFLNAPRSKTQLAPLSEIENGYQRVKKQYGSSIDDEYFIYQKLENGDLVMQTREYFEKNLERYQGYFIKLK